MLSNIRNFSKTIFAKILLVIIIIPFVFWGMGGIFNSGNTNNIVKLNNHSISTQDFINYINNSKIDSKKLKENIDKNILEEILSSLISKTILDMEIKRLNLILTNNSLAHAIKNNQNFLDKTKKFSRLKYEKFLISQNLSATQFEKKYENAELKKKLFTYISGGIKSPIFLTNNFYLEQASKLEISFINLNNNYKKIDEFTDNEIKNFVEENKAQLKKDYIDFTYLKITPNDLTNSNEFSKLFYKKIDEIENKISNGSSIENLSKDYKISPISKKNFLLSEENNIFENKIYAQRNNDTIQLLEENNFYIIYQVNRINKVLPSFEDNEFINEIKRTLYQIKKYEYNQELLIKISNKEFKNKNFDALSRDNTKNILLNSIKDTKKFTADSLKVLYSLPINSFTLITDNNKNIYVAKILKIIRRNISKNSNEFINFKNQAEIKLRDNLFSSYDLFINNNYEIKVNQKTLEKVKNFFK